MLEINIVGTIQILSFKHPLSIPDDLLYEFDAIFTVQPNAANH